MALEWTYEPHERESLLYHAGDCNEFARFKQPADKAPIRRCSYMSVIPLILQRSMTMQIYIIFPSIRCFQPIFSFQIVFERLLGGLCNTNKDKGRYKLVKTLKKATTLSHREHGLFSL